MAKRRMPDELMFLVNRRAVQRTTDASMSGKVCVVSGSTSGVGLSAVRRLARGGAHIVLVCRNREKAETVRRELVAEHGVRVDVVIADFSNLDDVRRAVQVLLKDYPRIDVLINSVGLHSTSRILTRAGFELVFCVNHLGPFLLTYLLLDRLRQTMTICAPPRARRLTADSPTPEVEPETTQTFPDIEASVIRCTARRFTRNISSSGILRFAIGSSSTRSTGA